MTRTEQAAAAVAAARSMFADASALSTATHQEVTDLLTQTAELARIVQAQQVRLAHEVAKRSEGSADEAMCRKLGKPSAKGAIASAFGMRARDAAALLSMARATTAGVSLTGGDIAVKYPRVAAALDDGSLSLEQARAIVNTLEPAAPRADLEQLAWAEGALVDAAIQPDGPLVPELLVDQARLFVAVIDPDGVLPNAERERAMRSARLWQRTDGMWQLELVSPPEEGSALKLLLDAYMGPRVKVSFRDDPCNGCDHDDHDSDADGDREFDADAEDHCPHADELRPDEPCGCQRDPKGRHAADGSSVVDSRTLEQKRHDVVMGIFHAQAASGGAPRAGGEAPRLVFTGTIDAYDAYLHGTEHRDRALKIEHTGSIVPIESVDRLLCDAIVQRAVVDERGHVLDLGREQRLFTNMQKRALAAHYGGCATPGCGAPVSWTEAHHVIWWERDGKTDTASGVLLCSFCHHEVHAGRLLVVGTPGNWRIVPQLRPSDRYARTSRTSGTSGSSITAAHTAAAPLAMKLPDTDTSPAATLADPDPQHPSRDVELPGTPTVPTVRQPRRSAPIEARVRRRLTALRRSPRRCPVDLWPPARIVMRT
ncbi:HNH endonuclease signature motif containing protein [Agrococcus sp. KRD186]|uniref:HNH endonuclease signature motif containing protein n=1 Tax=Agrococcus sp. KRD186 TaxID=2729730 RepID=UPI0019D036AF|nr:HNH endonuclease signature motif containing protein [Agrococcus sp. KRD186]